MTGDVRRGSKQSSRDQQSIKVNMHVMQLLCNVAPHSLLLGNMIFQQGGALQSWTKLIHPSKKLVLENYTLF